LFSASQGSIEGLKGFHTGAKSATKSPISLRYGLEKSSGARTIQAIMKNEEALNLTAKIAAAYVSRNSVPVGELAALISDIHVALRSLGNEPEVAPRPDLVPAVPIRKSVTPDALICLEDGKPFKSLRRHLSAKHGMTPEQYREKWGLPATYPMTAPNYAKERSALAKSFGLGLKMGGGTTGAKAPATKAKQR
jgi:predicted transcriptional regulator